MRKALVLFIALMTISVPYAAAHPFILETSPSQAGSAPVGTSKVYVIFSEAVELDFSSLKVFDSSGNQIDNRDTRYHADEESLIVSTPPLEEGVYTVATKVLSRVDGHLVPNAFVFAVGDIQLTEEHLEDLETDTVFVPEAAARFPGLVGQTIVLGAAMASLIIWGTQNKQLIKTDLEKLKSVYHARFMSITGVGLGLVTVSNILILAVQTWRLESSVLDTLETTFGATWMFRMVTTAILLGVWFWMERGKHITRLNQIPMLVLSLILIGTTTMMGHGAASGQFSATLIDYVHNLVAALWIGGIIFFAFTLLPTFSSLDASKRERMALVMIPRFSIAFVIAVGVVIISGPVLMWLLESDVSLIAESTYGKLIMAKIAIASAMIAMGVFFQFKVQKPGEEAVKTKSIQIHRKLQKFLKIDTALGVMLLGVVALLANGTLPAGEIQKAEVQEALYDFQTMEFSGDVKFDIEIVPFTPGNNSINIAVSDLDGNPIPDFEALKVKVSNPQRSIPPIQVMLEPVQTEDGPHEFQGDAAIGFSGVWQIDAEAHRTENINETVVMQLLIKPRLDDIKTEIVEYEFPEAAKPLYPLFDGRNSIWTSDASAPKLWKFDLDSKEFESFQYDGLASMWLTQDHEGKIWFTDSQADQIGFIDPATGKITTAGLPELQPVIYENTSTFIQSDLDGNIWVAVTNKSLILKYDQDGGGFEQVRLPERDMLPFALALGPDGNIWFTELSQGKIGYIDPRTSEIVQYGAEIPLNAPESMLFDPDGVIWISEHGGNGIVKFNPVLETFERIPVLDTEALPYGMSFDRYGNIWIAQHTVDNLAVYDPDTHKLLEIPIPTAASFVQFTTADDQGNVWILEQQGNKLAMIKMTEIPFASMAEPAPDTDLKYAEVASPLVAMGILAASLFYVRNVHDKRRINGLVNSLQAD